MKAARGFRFNIVGLRGEMKGSGHRPPVLVGLLLASLQLVGCAAGDVTADPTLEEPAEEVGAARIEQWLTFRENSGLVSMEAENFTRNTSQGARNWTLTSTSGASGGSVMVASPNNGTVVNTGYTTNSPRLDYDVNFAQTGTYRVWVRGRDTGNTAGDNDSVHVGLDGAAVASADRIAPFSTSLGWTRDTLDNAVATLQVSSVGNHTVNVWMREDGFAFDKVVLTRDTALVPSGTGPGETSTPTTPPTCSPATYEAENMTKSTGGSVTSGWNIWSNGNISTSHTFTAGAVTLTVRARGSVAQNVWPHMVVSAGGQVIGQTNVTATSWTDYSFPYQATAGSRTITVAFDNDLQANGEDRNLFVDRVAVSCAATTCTNGQTQAGTTVCGLNGRGVFSQLCTSGVWQNTTTCNDPDVCINASTRAGTTACGANNRGLLDQVCTSGQWQNSSTCRDPDQCANGATRVGSTSCGTNRFYQQLCSAGVWADTTTCSAPNAAYFELELGTLSGTPAFTVGANTAASGGAYIQSASNSTASAGPSRVAIPFQVAAGSYVVWMRANASSVSNDSVYFSIDNGNFIRWNDFPGNGWVWDDGHNSDSNNSRVTFNLTAGAHVLTIANREAGFLLDKVYITSLGDTPSGLGGPNGVCGDALCSSGESCSSCASDCGTCVVCTEGQTRSGTTTCGLNGRGNVQQSCVAGAWANTNTCVDPDSCVDGSEQPSAVACGLNGRGTSIQLCVAGNWAASSGCTDPDVCVDGGSQAGSTTCGLNNRGRLLQQCQAGAWTNTSTCRDADTCTDGATRATTPCGLNNRGLVSESCVNGGWQTLACTDPDACLDNATRTGTTPCDDGGTLSQLCSLGQWGDTSTCVAAGRCGDDVCSATENCGSCAIDCGVCGLPTHASFEAELGTLSGTPAFQLGSDAAASGGAFIQATANSTNTAGPTRAAYTFSVQAGQYTLWLRGNAPTADDDSLWLSMDGATFIRWNDFPRGGWVWGDARNTDSAGARVTFTLTTGSHVLTIANRENGFLLDKFYITADGDTPTGLGLPSDFCGDAVCGGSEDCSLCESDCGTCVDSDGDGLPDPDDQCPSTPAGSFVDENGCDANDPQRSGEFLFNEEEFGGNGRTCRTCHSLETGTISPAQAQALFASDPTNELFRSVDSDDGVGTSYTQLLARATFRVGIDLPPNVFLTSNPSATSVVFRRGVPTTMNTPSLDRTLMWDGRAIDLFEQATGAISGHAEAPITPTRAQLEAIIAFEQTSPFFSSDTLRQFDAGGPAPNWPQGVTAAEQRGRRWFAEDAANAPRFNICGQCHGGPMTNATQANSGLPVGQHFQTVNISEFNTKANPTFQFTFPDARNPGRTVTVTTPDPGLALTTGRSTDVNFFKIPTLWGIKNTAPYFHDNSALTLEELVDHYENHLATFLPRNRDFPTPHVPSAQDKADIVAFLKLL